MEWARYGCVSPPEVQLHDQLNKGSAHSVHALNHWNMIQSASTDLLRLESELVYSFFGKIV